MKKEKTKPTQIIYLIPQHMWDFFIEENGEDAVKKIQEIYKENKKELQQLIIIFYQYKNNKKSNHDLNIPWDQKIKTVREKITKEMKKRIEQQPVLMQVDSYESHYYHLNR